MSGPRTTEVASTATNTRRCITCQCLLSRYNSDDVCSGCARSRGGEQSASPTVPPHVWANQDVRSALVDRNFGRVCQLVREYGHLRQEDMARLTELSQPFLSMLESGQRRLTNIDRIIALLNGLNVPIDVTGPMLRPTPAADLPLLTAS